VNASRKVNRAICFQHDFSPEDDVAEQNCSACFEEHACIFGWWKYLHGPALVAHFVSLRHFQEDG
jgi:hypothetical protein